MELIEQQVDRRIPWKRQRGKHTPRWMNKRIQKCIRRKRKKWKKFKESGRQEDYLAFKVIQSQTTLAVKEAKRDFEKKLAKNIKKDSKSFYAYYREKNRSRVGIGPLEDADGQPVTDEMEQATILNSFFSSVFTKEDATDYELPLTRFSEEDNIRLKPNSPQPGICREYSRSSTRDLSGANSGVGVMHQTVAHPVRIVWKNV